MTARDNLDFMSSRVEGVKQLVAAAATSLELAEFDFANEWLRYAGEELRSYEAEYEGAVRSLLKVMDKGLALGLALGTPEAQRVFYRLRKTANLELPDSTRRNSIATGTRGSRTKRL